MIINTCEKEQEIAKRRQQIHPKPTKRKMALKAIRYRHWLTKESLHGCPGPASSQNHVETFTNIVSA